MTDEVQIVVRYRLRAAEARAIAARMRHGKIRDLLFRNASDYDDMAQYMETMHERRSAEVKPTQEAQVSTRRRRGEAIIVRARGPSH